MSFSTNSTNPLSAYNMTINNLTQQNLNNDRRINEEFFKKNSSASSSFSSNSSSESKTKSSSSGNGTKKEFQLSTSSSFVPKEKATTNTGTNKGCSLI